MQSTELWTSCQDTLLSHIHNKLCGLTDLQSLGVQHAVRACPLQAGSVVVDRSKKFSLDKRISVTPKNVLAASRLVRQELRVVLTGSLLDGIVIDWSNGSKTRVAEVLSLPESCPHCLIQ